jgi:predicted aspartyl protease
MGMCGEAKTNGVSPIMATGATKGMLIKGVFDEWGRPVCDMVLSTGNKYTDVKAVIDTGAYHTHISTAIAEQLGAVCKSNETHNNPVHGKIELPVYMLIYSFKEHLDTHFVSDVRGMNFDADILIGMQFILEFCDLHIYSKEKRFELVFK